MARESKPVVWLKGQIKTPPFSVEARREAGALLRLVQDGQKLSMPQSRPMPSIGPGCHELRVRDADRDWRIVYKIARHAVVILEVFAKTTAQTPASVIRACRTRAQRFEDDLSP